MIDFADEVLYINNYLHTSSINDINRNIYRKIKTCGKSKNLHCENRGMIMLICTFPMTALIYLLLAVDQSLFFSFHFYKYISLVPNLTEVSKNVNF